MTCYFLDGSPAERLFRCDNSTDGESTCCTAGSICWSNGVCQEDLPGLPRDYTRAGCTDPTWRDPACLRECEELPHDIMVGIRPCDGIEDGTSYCCDDGEKGRGSFHCCNTKSLIFTLGKSPPTILAEMPTVWTPPASTETTTSSDPTLTSSGASARTSAADVEDAGASAGSDGSGGSGNLWVGVGVGLGVGLPAAAAIIGATIFFRRRKKSARAGATPVPTQPPEFVYDPPITSQAPVAYTPPTLTPQPVELPITDRKHELPS
ncbi:hypothetical protein VUR80DRAFT_2114 [Thermomyces stellatus]